jgi:hypothetical protein
MASIRRIELSPHSFGRRNQKPDAALGYLHYVNGYGDNKVIPYQNGRKESQVSFFRLAPPVSRSWVV